VSARPVLADTLDMLAPVWALSRPHQLLWRDWGDSGAAYDAGSGDTHLISALAIELLELLSTAPRTEAALGLELVDALGDAESEAVASLIGEQLTSLHGLGLVQPTPGA
jgi:PqqD family protein of HPr-rel-A system